MASYKGIEFAKGYNKSFAGFKKEFASTHVFNKMSEEQKEEALKEAYKIATDGNISKSKKKSKPVGREGDN